jgi:MerR family transcriptional regulator, redox-sensitive transcriptional activator SoxR
MLWVDIIRSFRAVVRLDDDRVRVKVDLMSRVDRKESPPPESLPIGEVARLSGKAPSAIRYYEEVGLLHAPERIDGRRRYPRAVVRTLAVIETAQRAGLSLDEIRLLLEATPSDRAATQRLREVAEQKLPVLREAIERAEIVRGWLEDAARCCCPTLDECPLFDEPVRLPERSLALR